MEKVKIGVSFCFSAGVGGNYSSQVGKTFLTELFKKKKLSLNG